MALEIDHGLNAGTCPCDHIPKEMQESLTQIKIAMIAALGEKMGWIPLYSFNEIVMPPACKGPLLSH